MNPLRKYIWIGVALAVVLWHIAFGAFMHRAGKLEIRHEWDESIAAANTEARRMEQSRQSRADEAARSAVSRQVGLSADAAGAGDVLGRLRGAIAARRLAEESHAAAVERADTTGKLLIESATAYRELAATCDRHTSDLRLLLDAWPK